MYNKHTPCLVAPRGDRLLLTPGRSTIGRDERSTIRISDDSIDHQHAYILCTDSDVHIVDLGSMTGTFVNDSTVPAGVGVPLRDGDVVRIGTTKLLYRDLPAPTATRSMVDPEVTFNTGPQTAEQINNVGGNQYLQQQRESFMREIAASRTRARRFIWLGLVLFLGGVAAYGAMILQFVGNADDGTEQSFETYGLVGFGVAGVGSVMLVIGIILHVVATSRRRRALSDPTWVAVRSVR